MATIWAPPFIRRAPELETVAPVLLRVGAVSRPSEAALPGMPTAQPIAPVPKVGARALEEGPRSVRPVPFDPAGPTVEMPRDRLGAFSSLLPLPYTFVAPVAKPLLLGVTVPNPTPVAMARSGALLEVKQDTAIMLVLLPLAMFL